VVRDAASLGNIGQVALAFVPAYQKVQLHAVRILRNGEATCASATSSKLSTPSTGKTPFSERNFWTLQDGTVPSPPNCGASSSPHRRTERSTGAFHADGDVARGDAEGNG
jgi:hypothetical protein